VSRFLILDSGPLGLLTHPQRNAEVVAIAEWLFKWLLSGHQVIIPAIVYYELKRELIRAGKNLGLARLQAFASITPGRYLPLSDEALQLAAELWAKARQQGRPTADVKDLDVDVILAAQALSFGPASGDVIVATTNSKHLSQFVAAKDWHEIVP
jgi:predicted nucleic acid-binding protein